MPNDIQPGTLAPLAKGQKVGHSLELYDGRVMPRTFGEVIEFAQMMCKAEGAIAPPLVGNPGACMSIIQRSLSWQVDPWAVATKVYLVNGILAYEAQLISAIVKKWAPIREKAIPYVYEGEGLNMTCSITVHHQDTGEAYFYKSPKISEIDPRKSPLWKTDPRQQLGYYSIRAMARRHFPDIILGVYDPDEARTMRDVTPREERKVDNFLEDEGTSNPVEEINTTITPDQIAANMRASAARGTATEGSYNPETGEIEIRQVEAKPEPVVFGVVIANMVKAASSFTSLTMLEGWLEESAADIEALPEEARGAVMNAVNARRNELSGL
jgi:hypothetical protein